MQTVGQAADDAARRFLQKVSDQHECALDSKDYEFVDEVCLVTVKLANFCRISNNLKKKDDAVFFRFVYFKPVNPKFLKLII